MTSRTRTPFPKEVIDSVVAHSKEAKKNLVTERRTSTKVDASSTSPSSPLENEMSQTKPKVSADFERVFSKVIGSQNPSTSKPMDYSETYQRAFGRTAAQKSTHPPKREEPLKSKSVVEAKPTPNTIATEKGRKEGLSTSYMTVFGRLVRDEDRDGTGAEIRESLKKSVENAEETKIIPEATPSGISVFERFSHSDSASKDKDSRVAKIQGTAQNEEIKITLGEKPAQSGKSVFERLSHSNS